jgi:hypothetical protein
VSVLVDVADDWSRLERPQQLTEKAGAILFQWPQFAVFVHYPQELRNLERRHAPRLATRASLGLTGQGSVATTGLIFSTHAGTSFRAGQEPAT